MAPAMSVANKNFLGKRVVARQTRAARAAVARRNAKLVVKAGAYDEELIATAVSQVLCLNRSPTQLPFGLVKGFQPPVA